MTASLLGVFALAAAASFVSTPVVRFIAHRLGALDRPGPHKSHAVPLPRLGGVAVAIGWVAGVAVATWGLSPVDSVDHAHLSAMVAAGLLVFATGLWDDLRPLSPAPKLIAECLAAALVVGAGVIVESVTLFGVTLHTGGWGVLVSAAWIVTITNAMNMVDGVDGLATGLAIIAGVTCAAISIVRAEFGTAVALAALVGGLVGFLPFNFRPASIFLGDSGSLLCGFVLAATAITGTQKGATALAAGVPLLIFALPLADVTAAVARRAARAGSRGWTPSSLSAILRPDRLHIHHRLVALGLSERGVVLVLYAVSGALSILALITMD